MREDFSLYSASPAFAWLCLAFAAYLALRAPVANALLPLSTALIGNVPIIGWVTYGRFSILLGLLTVISILSSRREAGIPMSSLVLGRQRWFVFLCFIVLVKIGFETASLGLDATRRSSLIGGLHDTAFPLAVVLLALNRRPMIEVERHLIFGMMAYPLIAALGPVWFAFQNGLLASSLQGTERFAFGKVDTINSARIVCHGAIASILIAGPWLRLPIAMRIAAIPVCAAQITLLALTGTRQYMVAFSVFIVLSVLKLVPSLKLKVLIAILGLPMLFYSVAPIIANADIALVGRFSLDSLEAEATESRGYIWQRAFAASAASPLLGSGFRNFGDEFEVIDSEGNTRTLRDTAHGAIQDVFAEHGLLLGTAYLLGVLQLVFCATKYDRYTSLGRALSIAFISLQAAMLFSSAFLNATPIYLTLLLFHAWQAPKQQPALASSFRVDWPQVIHPPQKSPSHR